MHNDNQNLVDHELIQIARNYLADEYTHNKHHVAVALRAGKNVYKSLHIDTSGFDICAEPIAIHNALQNGESEFIQIVAVSCNNSGYCVINPCGNCRQLLLEYTPEIDVVIKDSKNLVLKKPNELLPYPYGEAYWD